jgi:hypothetical protein
MADINAQPVHSHVVKRPSNPLPEGSFGAGRTERCVEVPWAESWLRGRSKILDIGFALSDLDWLRTLLGHGRAGASITAVDIIAPSRVASRYPDDLRDQALAVPIISGDVRTAAIQPASFDTITCISTIEHIGFDAAGSTPDSAFARWRTLEETPTERDPGVTASVMAAFRSALSIGGLLIISVPMGRGGAVPVRDSLGFYTRQHEYNAETWPEITQAEGFSLVEQRFFGWLGEGGDGWSEVFAPEALADRTAWLTPHAMGVALAVLERVL